MYKVLAIETSCDETSVSIVSNIGDTFRIHSNIIASQIQDHSKWGGVVPELAARAIGVIPRNRKTEVMIEKKNFISCNL